MRLIDADEFCRYTDEHCQDGFADLWKELIRRQPTAFDKEKVINEIQISAAGMVVNMNVSTSYAEGYIDAAKDIIEIVKRDGLI